MRNASKSIISSILHSTHARDFKEHRGLVYHTGVILSIALRVLSTLPYL